MFPAPEGNRMSEETIPLFDGEPTGASIIQTGHGSIRGATAVRCRRGSPRRACEHVHVCFTPHYSSGRIQHVECPAINISIRGFAIEFDEQVQKGTAGYLDYRTVSGRPVHVRCVVRRCAPLENGHYLLGLELDRKLQFDECKPARRGLGREIAPGMRPRKLREPSQVATEPSPVPRADSESPGNNHTV